MDWNAWKSFARSVPDVHPVRRDPLSNDNDSGGDRDFDYGL